jgi:hypothetical protein
MLITLRFGQICYLSALLFWASLQGGGRKHNTTNIIKGRVSTFRGSESIPPQPPYRRSHGSHRDGRGSHFCDPTRPTGRWTRPDPRVDPPKIFNPPKYFVNHSPWWKKAQRNKKNMKLRLFTHQPLLNPKPLGKPCMAAPLEFHWLWCWWKIRGT